MMPDREKVIEALVKARTAEENYKLQSAEMSFQFIEMLIELLKEQKTQKFFVDESGKITPLPVVVRCKDCKHRGNSEKCVLAAVSKEKDYPLFMLDNRGDWFCADGVNKDE